MWDTESEEGQIGRIRRVFSGREGAVQHVVQE